MMLFLIYSINIVREPSFVSSQRVVVFIVSLSIIIFLLPDVINRRTFASCVCFISGLLVLIGLPAVFFGPYTIGPILVDSYHYGNAIPLLGWNYWPLTSVLANPNYMGPITVIGTLTGIERYSQSRRLIYLPFLFINFFGVYLTNSRNAQLGLLIALFLLILHRYLSSRNLWFLLLTSIVSSIVIILMYFSVLPGPRILNQVDLRGRDDLWTAAWLGLHDKPIFGWGAIPSELVLEDYLYQIEDRSEHAAFGVGPHNSYVRLFLSTGYVGGFLYSILFICLMKKILFKENPYLLSQVTSIVIMQMFASPSIFGLSLTSLLWGATVGYTHHAICEYDINSRNA